MRPSTKHILVPALACLALVAVLGLGACSRSSVSGQLTAPAPEGAASLKAPLEIPTSPPEAGQPPPPKGVPGVPARLRSMSLAPISMSGGTTATATIKLMAPAPAAGALVLLTSSDPAAVIVPAALTVPAGASQALLTVQTIPVATNHAATIQASSAGTSFSAKLTVVAPVLAAVTLAPAPFQAGMTAMVTVSLTGAAPSPGAVVSLSSSLPGVLAVPSTITVPAGASSVPFATQTKLSPIASSVILTATYKGLVRRSTVSVGAFDPCASVVPLGGTLALTSIGVPQFRANRLRIDLAGDVPVNWLNAMGPCVASAKPSLSIVSGTASVVINGTRRSVTNIGGALAFGPLTMPVPAEAGTVLALDGAANELAVIWPILANGVPGSPVLRCQLSSWTADVVAGVQLDATLSIVVRAPDGSTATFSATGTHMIVPPFIP